MSPHLHGWSLIQLALACVLIGLTFVSGCATPVYDQFDLEDELANVLAAQGTDLDAAAVALREWLVANELRIRETSGAALAEREAGRRDDSSRKTFNAGWSVRQERSRQLMLRLDPEGRWYSHPRVSKLLRWFVTLEGPVPPL